MEPLLSYQISMFLGALITQIMGYYTTGITYTSRLFLTVGKPEFERLAPEEIGPEISEFFSKGILAVVEFNVPPPKNLLSPGDIGMVIKMLSYNPGLCDNAVLLINMEKDGKQGFSQLHIDFDAIHVDTIIKGIQSGVMEFLEDMKKEAAECRIIHLLDPDKEVLS